jgi:endonuclease III
VDATRPKSMGGSPVTLEEQTQTDTLTEKALEIHRRLIEAYGTPASPADTERDPVASLVNTILSQNTNDRNRDLAFSRLRERFSTWAQVRDAPVAEVIEAVTPAGLAPTKAPRIQHALRVITQEQGGISLDFLKELPLEEARAWLLDLDGVGPKTAAIVLLFAMDRPAFPVDTHVHRVTRRLGLIANGTSREKAYLLLEALLPEELYYPAHLNIIEHGRAICSARKPQCERCPLQDLCDYYQGREDQG